MWRPRRSWTTLLALVLLGLFAAWVAGRFEASSPGKTVLSVIDAGGTEVRYPGDLKRISQFGREAWVAVYQRTEGGVPTVYAREAPALTGPFGPEARVSDPQLGPAYDPGVVALPDGGAIVTWSALARVFYAARVAPNRYGPVQALFHDRGGWVQEQTAYRFLGTSFILYAYRPFDRVERLWDVRLRTLGDGPTVGPPVPVVSEGPGPGPEGVQKRITAAPTGAGRELVAVWSEHPAVAGGPRTISGAISSDAGETWGSSFKVCSFPGHDLVNPFAVLVRPDDLRVYFAQDAHVPPLGYVRSSDHGRSWSNRRDVDRLPPDATPARIVVALDPALGPVAFVTTTGFRELGTFPLGT